ncbi:Hypothetical predicted protein [Pelobates cultripes]|uniref:Uncharacterized protein n=1 Tax=Pelobates cultripes TaxID=61616 RepID=A0AAD1VMY4_PELCU|nr:Hypothetical predicted protein [Pelobates cultripes]
MVCCYFHWLGAESPALSTDSQLFQETTRVSPIPLLPVTVITVPLLPPEATMGCKHKKPYHTKRPALPDSKLPSSYLSKRCLSLRTAPAAVDVYLCCVMTSHVAVAYIMMSYAKCRNHKRKYRKLVDIGFNGHPLSPTPLPVCTYYHL